MWIDDPISIFVLLGFQLSIHGRAGLYVPLASQSREGRITPTSSAEVILAFHKLERVVTGRGGSGFALCALVVAEVEVFDAIVCIYMSGRLI